MLEWGRIREMGKAMAEVAKVDDRGRIRLPRGMAQPGGSVVIVGSRSYFLGILIPPDPLQHSGSWLRVKEDVTSLKKEAEEDAASDAVKRATRRGQRVDDRN
jgi:hypothetical protein